MGGNNGDEETPAVFWDPKEFEFFVSKDSQPIPTDWSEPNWDSGFMAVGVNDKSIDTSMTIVEWQEFNQHGKSSASSRAKSTKRTMKKRTMKSILKKPGCKGPDTGPGQGPPYKGPNKGPRKIRCKQQSDDRKNMYSKDYHRKRTEFTKGKAKTAANLTKAKQIARQHAQKAVKYALPKMHFSFGRGNSEV